MAELALDLGQLILRCSRRSTLNIVLIEHLDLEFSGGLSVLTGETGAGKSILLDALGLSIGACEAGMVRAQEQRASVTATFDVNKSHPARAFLGENDIADEDESFYAGHSRRMVAAGLTSTINLSAWD